MHALGMRCPTDARSGPSADTGSIADAHISPCAATAATPRGLPPPYLRRALKRPRVCIILLDVGEPVLNRVNLLQEMNKGHEEAASDGGCSR